jgi:hypothetical protein
MASWRKEPASPKFLGNSLQSATAGIRESQSLPKLYQVSKETRYLYSFTSTEKILGRTKKFLASDGDFNDSTIRHFLQ